MGAPYANSMKVVNEVPELTACDLHRNHFKIEKGVRLNISSEDAYKKTFHTRLSLPPNNFDPE
ncbi:MAG: hypothetical protein IMF18_03940 [Proteobacteria bacterium]|nr:hypothetical protein [Pseudomonadota bacterium]